MNVSTCLNWLLYLSSLKINTQQDLNDFHEEPAKFPSFQVDQFSDFSDVTHGDMSKNPFLASSPDPVAKKSSPSHAKIFQKPAEIIMASKSTRYDVFKNDNSNSASEQQQVMSAKRDDPFQDFAKAAFSEFKVDRMMGHEFSNKLSSTKGFQPPPTGSSKVNWPSVLWRSSAYCKKNCLATNKSTIHTLYSANFVLCPRRSAVVAFLSIASRKWVKDGM